jgi:hypothetical protein
VRIRVNSWSPGCFKNSLLCTLQPPSKCAIHTCESARADHRLIKGMSRRSQTKADDVMKDNVRHVPGSNRSFGTALSRSTTPTRRLLAAAKSTYKTQTKRIQNRECDFFIRSTSDIYNFKAVKCLHFRRRDVALHANEQGPAAETYHHRMPLTVDRCSFAPGEKVSIRDKLVPSRSTSHPWQLLYSNCIKCRISVRPPLCYLSFLLCERVAPCSCVVPNKMGNFETNSHSVRFRQRCTRHL